MAIIEDWRRVLTHDTHTNTPNYSCSSRTGDLISLLTDFNLDKMTLPLVVVFPFLRSQNFHHDTSWNCKMFLSPIKIKEFSWSGVVASTFIHSFLRSLNQKFKDKPWQQREAPPLQMKERHRKWKSRKGKEREKMKNEGVRSTIMDCYHWKAMKVSSVVCACVPGTCTNPSTT